MHCDLLSLLFRAFKSLTYPATQYGKSCGVSKKVQQVFVGRSGLSLGRSVQSSRVVEVSAAQQSARASPV